MYFQPATRRSDNWETSTTRTLLGGKRVGSGSAVGDPRSGGPRCLLGTIRMEVEKGDRRLVCLRPSPHGVNPLSESGPDGIRKARYSSLADVAQSGNLRFHVTIYQKRPLRSPETCEKGGGRGAQFAARRYPNLVSPFHDHAGHGGHDNRGSRRTSPHPCVHH